MLGWSGESVCELWPYMGSSASTRYSVLPQRGWQWDGDPRQSPVLAFTPYFALGGVLLSILPAKVGEGVEEAGSHTPTAVPVAQSTGMYGLVVRVVGH